MQHRFGAFVTRCVAMLCVALALAFATSSTASVVDRLQHANDIAHQHPDQVSVHVEDLDGDHAADFVGAGDLADDDGPSDRHTGAGHHHIDAPVGVADLPREGVMPPLAVTIAQPDSAATRADSLPPGGLDRPPRALADIV